MCEWINFKNELPPANKYYFIRKNGYINKIPKKIIIPYEEHRKYNPEYKVEISLGDREMDERNWETIVPVLFDGEIYEWFLIPE